MPFMLIYFLNLSEHTEQCTCSSKHILAPVSLLLTVSPFWLYQLTATQSLHISIFFFSEFLPIPDTWIFLFDATSLLTLAYRGLLAKRRICKAISSCLHYLFLQDSHSFSLFLLYLCHVLIFSCRLSVLSCFQFWLHIFFPISILMNHPLPNLPMYLSFPLPKIPYIPPRSLHLILSKHSSCFLLCPVCLLQHLLITSFTSD